MKMSVLDQGAVDLNEGNYTSALAKFDEALKDSDEEAEQVTIHLMRAQTLFNLHKYAEAIGEANICE